MVNAIKMDGGDQAPAARRPLSTLRGLLRERILEELYRRPGVYLSTRQLFELIDEADDSSEVAALCSDLRKAQRLCHGPKIMGGNGVPANSWGLSEGERQDMERRRPELAALEMTMGLGKSSHGKKKTKAGAVDTAAKAPAAVNLAAAPAEDDAFALVEQRPALERAFQEELDSLRQQLSEQETRLGDLEQAEARAVYLADDLAHAREDLEVTRAALDTARTDLSNAQQDRRELQARLDDRDAMIASQSLTLQELRTEAEELIAARDSMHRDLKDALTEVASMEALRDSFMDILRERDSRLAEAQGRIDALMLVVRPHFGAPRDPEPDQPAGPEATLHRHLPAGGLASAPTWHVNLASEPFNLPRVPKDWLGELSLRLLGEHDASLKFKVDSEGEGACCQFKADAVIDHSGADFVPGLANGLIHLMDYLFPHSAGDWPPDTARQTATDHSHSRTLASSRAVQAPAAELRP